MGPEYAVKIGIKPTQTKRLVSFWFCIIVLALLFCVIAQWLAPSLFDWLRWEPSALEGEYWRLLSGHFVHLGVLHGLLNIAALLMVGYLFSDDWYRIDLLLMAISIPITSLLLFASDLSWYVGFSGVLHGWFLLGALRVWQTQRTFSVLLLTVLMVKLILEPHNVMAPMEAEWLGGPVAYVAHQLGVLAMIFLFACACLWDRVRR